MKVKHTETGLGAPKSDLIEHVCFHVLSFMAQ